MTLLINWQRSIEQIVVASKDCRLLGLTSARRGAGVSLICRRVGKTMAVNGMKTLVVALSEPQGSLLWNAADKPAAAGAVRASIVPSTHGYDLLPAFDAEGRSIAANVVQLRQLLDTELADYTRIILDLPPISQVSADGLSAVAVSVICDRILLVCEIGADRKGEVAEAVSLLRSAGATVSGIVANEHKRVDPWERLSNNRFFRRGRPAAAVQK